MTIERRAFAWGFVALTACSQPTGSEPAPSASAASRSLEADLSAYCGSVCKRSTSCGLEAADGIVRGNPSEVALLSHLKADAAKTEAVCRDSCRATPSSEIEPARLAKAATCVEQSSCDALEACLTASSR